MGKEMPIYVKVDEYKEVLEIISQIKKKLSDAKSLMSEINEIKNEEDKELARWESTLEGVDAKLDFIDKVLFEPEGA